MYSKECPGHTSILPARLIQAHCVAAAPGHTRTSEAARPVPRPERGPATAKG